MEHKCNEKFCKEPIWLENPLIYIQCEHPKCRICLTKLFERQEYSEWITVGCDKCEKQDEAQVKNILKSADSCISVSQITEKPKKNIKDASIICSTHEKQEIIFFCSLCDCYGCFDCMDVHIEHKNGNVTKIKEQQVFDQLKNIYQDLDESHQKLFQVKKNIKEIFEKEKEADSSTVLQLITKSKNINYLFEFLEKQKENELIYIGSQSEQINRKKEFITNQSEITRLQETENELKNQIKSLSNEKEQLWQEKIAMQNEKEKLTKPFLEKNENDLLQLQKEFDQCPLKSDDAQQTFKRLGGMIIKEMEPYNYENKPKQLKSIQNIDISGFVYKEGWNYYGQVELNQEIPSGFGRAIAKDNSRFIDCYFLNGQCHGKVRFIFEKGQYAFNELKYGKKNGEEIGFYQNGIKQYELNLLDGVQIGKRTNYYESGNKKSEYLCQNGKLNGEYIYYNDNKDGSIDKIEYYENNKIVKK